MGRPGMPRHVLVVRRNAHLAAMRHVPLSDTQRPRQDRARGQVWAPQHSRAWNRIERCVLRFALGQGRALIAGLATLAPQSRTHSSRGARRHITATRPQALVSGRSSMPVVLCCAGVLHLSLWTWTVRAPLCVDPQHHTTLGTSGMVVGRCEQAATTLP